MTQSGPTNSSLECGFVDGEGIQTVARANEQILPAVEHVSDRPGAGCGHQRRVPQDLAVRRLESDEVLSVVREQQLARRGQRVRDPAAARPLVPPGDLAGPVIDRQRAPTRRCRRWNPVRPSLAVVRRCRSGSTCCRTRLDADVEQAGFGIEARRLPVRGAAGGGRNQHAVRRRILRGIGNRLALCVEILLRPIQRVDERLRQDLLAGGAVQHEEVAVAAGLRHQLARLAVDHAVEQHRRLHRVPIVHVVRRGLEIPDQLAGVRIERHDRAGVKVVALAALLRHHRIRIAGADDVQVQLGIVGAGNPRLPGAVRGGVFIGPGLDARLALARRGPPLPLQRAGLRDRAIATKPGLSRWSPPMPAIT